NGCVFCLNMHTKEARQMGETEQRIYGLSAWQEAPYYTDKERAALALTEAVTLVSESRVPDEVYKAAQAVFTAQEIATITMAIVVINSWNRIAITSRTLPQG
ncbi:carboxymuconolactone decarboxylase family protein, partial [Chitinophaga sp.]|uniref:carboxymuconolactone decarboxylase family protein n=1 Tax=Chitinophaga sp. TaxID=1869181 RepID=UPI002BB0CA82